MKTRDTIYNILLILSLIGLAVWFGGTLYQMLVIVPMWSYEPPASVHAFFEGTRYNETIWNFFGPPFMAARLLPLFGATILGWHLRPHRKWLMIATAGMVFGVVFTLLYVYPMNDALFTNAGRGLEPEAVRDLVNKWILADRVRFIVGAIAFFSLLHAYTLPIQRDQ